MIDRGELERRVNAFPRWHYAFELDGVTTPIFDPTYVNRHEQRRRYILDPVVDLFGGSLAGKRILDVGCNAGWWSLSAIERGADFVLGVDGRQMHVDQANLVFEAKGIPSDRYRFVTANVFDVDLTAEEPFDIVFCFALLGHINKQVALMELLSSVNRDVLVIDASLAMAAGSWFQVRHDDIEVPSKGIDYELVFLATRPAVLDLVRLFGYSAVVLRPPAFSDTTGMADYVAGARRGFVAAKHTDLSRLAADSEETPLRAALVHQGAQLARVARRRLRRR